MSEQWPDDYQLPNLDDILDDIPDLEYDSKAITEEGINGAVTEEASTSFSYLADLDQGSAQEGDWFSEPEFDYAKNYNESKSNWVTDPSLAEPEGDSTQGEDWDSEAEFALLNKKTVKGIDVIVKQNPPPNITAEDGEGSDDADSPTDLTDWSTLEQSSFLQTFEDPAFTDPNLMEYPGSTEQGFDEPLLDG